jgi:DNA-binding NarL/FixJ family response regulator
MSQINVFIVDDDPFIRESLTLLLGLDSEITIVGTASNGDEAVEAISILDDVPNVVLMDIRMPICDGVEGTLKVKALNENISVLILTTFDDDEFIIEALRNGASGYLLKNIPPDRIIQGIKTIFGGSMLIHPDVARKLSGLLRPSSPVRDQHDWAKELTTAEFNIVTLISEGMSNKEIASKLFLSEGTVKNYITEILSKLGVRDRTQIAIMYLRS